MATHPSALVWRIPRTEEPGGLQSIESQSQTQLKQLSAHICMPAGLDEAQAGIKIAGRTINNLRHADDTSPTAESKELKSLLKEDSEKGGLELNIQETKISASGPITSWEIDEETVTDFIFWGSKITAGGDCSHEIKRCFLLGRKVMTNLDSIF